MPATRASKRALWDVIRHHHPFHFTEIHSITNTTNNLANFDFQILIDTSGSMGSDDALAKAFEIASFLADLDDGLHAKFDIVDTMTQAKADSYPSLAALINDALAG